MKINAAKVHAAYAAKPALAELMDRDYDFFTTEQEVADRCKGTKVEKTTHCVTFRDKRGTLRGEWRAEASIGIVHKV